jgi:hypothetical protein
MDRWEVHSFATTLSTSGTAKFTIAAFRYFNDTVPDVGGNVSLVLVIAPVGAIRALPGSMLPLVVSDRRHLCLARHHRLRSPHRRQHPLPQQRCSVA